MKDAFFWTSTTEARPCPLCGRREHTVVSERMQHSLDLVTVICNECSFVFTNPLPARETYERFYRDAYADYYGHITTPPPATTVTQEPADLRAKFERIERVRPLKGSRVLELGPGQGLFLWWAQHRGCSVLGIEPSPKFCSVLAQAGLPHLQCSLDGVDAVTVGQFDIIAMFHVLEHFFDPNEALSQCRSLLAPRGLLAVEVPNILKPFGSLDRYFLRYVHPSSFSPTTLEAVLAKHGFRSVHTDEGGNDWRSPQNLFVIAENQNDVSDPSLSGPGEVAQVLHAFQDYRRRWRRGLVLKWQARRLALLLKRSAMKAGRPVKRVIFGGRGRSTA